MSKKPIRSSGESEAHTEAVPEKAAVVKEVGAPPKLFKIKATAYFKDGNVWPKAIQAEEIIEVTKQTFEQLKASAPRNWEGVNDA